MKNLSIKKAYFFLNIENSILFKTRVRRYPMEFVKILF